MSRPAIMFALAAAIASGCATAPTEAQVPAPAAAPPPASVPPPAAAAPAAAPPVVEVPPAAPSAPAPAAHPRTMPAVQPSGVREDWKRCTELEAAVKGAKTLDEQSSAKKAVADHLAGFPARWEGKEVPAPEACYYAVMLQKCKRYGEAARQARRYIEVAPEDSANFVNAHTILVGSLAQAGEFDAAEAELKQVADTVYGNHLAERAVVEETIANSMLKANRLDLAAERFRAAAEGRGDLDAAKMAVDCYQRLDRIEDARGLAARMPALVDGEKPRQAAGFLVAQLDLVGKPAPGFAGARWWKGEDGPVADADLRGRVTVVFSWNMKSAWNQFFFERMHRMAEGFAGKPVRFVGISRLARFNPITLETDPGLTEEAELTFYDMWKEQYPVDGPLAVGGYQEGALVDAWAAFVVPYFVVVGKDGIVTYVRTGKDEEHFEALRAMVERALAR